MSKKSSRKKKSNKKTKKLINQNELGAQKKIEKKPQGKKQKTESISKAPSVFRKDLEEAIDKITPALKKTKKEKAEQEALIESTAEKTKKLLFSGFDEKIKETLSAFWKECINIAKLFSKFFLVIFLCITILVFMELISNNRILPRTKLAGLDLGYTKAQEAETQIKSAIEKFTSTPIKFVYSETEQEFTLNELGISILLPETLANLPVYKINDGSLLRVVLAGIQNKQFYPVYLIDKGKIKNTLEAKFNLAEKKAKNAAFYYDEKKTIQISDEKPGIQVDTEALNKDLENALNNLSSEAILIRIEDDKPTVTADDLRKNSDSLLQRLDSEIIMKYSGKEWKFKITNHLADLDYSKDGDQISIKITEKLLNEFFQPKVFDFIEKQTSDIKIYYNEENKIVFDGKAEDGIKVVRSEFIKDMEAAINTYQEEIETKTEINKAKIETDQKLQEQGIKDLLGIGHTAFEGSTPNRIHNINVAINKYNGIIIDQGATFSFNDILGEVDGASGYKLELVIKSTGTVPEYGGGVCQVSSTAFKAALFSGLPIVERSPHSYAVSYYAQVDGYGLDATIYPGVKDLKFLNDTPGPILIQSYTDGVQAYYKFYGTSDGRQSRLENYNKFNYRSSGGTQTIPTNTLPQGARKQVETAHAGFDTSWDRVILKADGTEQRDNIYSRYRATANKVLVGE